MMPALKSEFRKLLTARSTYLLTGFVLLVVTFFSVFVFGYKQSVQKASSPIFMNDVIFTALGIFVTFVAIISILLVAHEYRYNTVLYTLTAAKSRIKILAAKVIVMLTYATVAGLLIVCVAYGAALLGLSIGGHTLSPQSFSMWQAVWQYTTYVWLYALLGITLALLIRGLVGSIVTFFLIPAIEGILQLALKGDSKYLPIRALDAIPAPSGTAVTPGGQEMLANESALALFTVYIAIAFAIATVLFIKRDAN